MNIIDDYVTKLKRKKKYSLNTIISYSNDVHKFLNFIKKDISKVTLNDINEFLLKDSPSTANRRLMSLRNFYKIMIEEGVTDNFPFTSQTFKNLRNIPKRMAVRMTVPEGLKFLEQARHKKRDFAIMMTFLNTGIRESELFNLKKSDYGNNKLRLIGKGDKERIVSVNHMTQTAINNYLAQRTDHKEWLFISNKKGKYSPSGLYTLVKTIAKKAGIEKNITPHTLRHTFASMMKSQGRDAYEIMQILGHNDIRTTMIYLGTLEDDRVEAILEESAFNV